MCVCVCPHVCVCVGGGGVCQGLYEAVQHGKVVVEKTLQEEDGGENEVQGLPLTHRQAQAPQSGGPDSAHRFGRSSAECGRQG